MGKLFVVNAPWVFSAAWRVIQNFFDKHMQEKIFILSGSKEAQAEVLIREIGADLVPVDLGGNYDGDGGGIMCEMDAYYALLRDGTCPIPSPTLPPTPVVVDVDV